MKSKRIYLLPVISFSLLVVFRITFLIVALNAIHQFKDTLYAAVLRKNLIGFESFFWPALLIFEIIIYLAIRKRIYKKLWVIFHSWHIMIAFFVLPLLSLFVSNVLSRYFPPKEYADLVNQISLVRLILFYLFIGAGHLFFILTIVKSFSNKQITVINETSGVLDEFVR